MICPKCGARLAQGSTICPICGTKIRPSKVKVQDNYEEQPDQGYDSDSDDDYEENLNDDYDYDEEDDSYGNDDYDNDDYEPARPKTNRILVVIIVTVIALIAAMIVLIVLLFSSGKKSNKQIPYTVDKIQDTDTKKETQKETQKETETEVVEIKDNKVTSGRNVYELSNDELKLVEYNDQGQVVRIPAEIGGYSVTSIGSHAFKNNTSVQYLKLPDGMKKLDDSALSDIELLKEVVVPESVEEIGNLAFSKVQKAICVKGSFAWNYMKYMAEKEMELTEVYQLDYEKQTEHFVEFLYWLKAGNHTEQTAGEKKCPNEGTCNAYLKDVFRFYLFIEAEYEQYGSLKTLSYNQIIAVNQVGVKKVLRNHSFKAYLKEEEHRGRTAKENQIITILQACTNRRDQLLLLMLAETGYRIGELLGVKYVKDIDYRNHMIRVCFREDNENEARAKNAEYRSAKISNDTFEFLMDYLAKYRKILQHQDYLFVNIMGENIGKPLRVDSVYDMLDRMEKKTGVKITPHMLRHYFANMRKQAGWELEMISQALGHKHLDTTIKYLDWLDDELIEASNEFYAQHTAIYGAERLLE